MSARNSHANKAARRLVRGERVERKGAADRIGSSGNTSPAGLRRLSQMQPRQAGPKLKTIPLSDELRDQFVASAKRRRHRRRMHDIGDDVLVRRLVRHLRALALPPTPPWPPWLEDAKRARAGKRSAA